MFIVADKMDATGYGRVFYVDRSGLSSAYAMLVSVVWTPLEIRSFSVRLRQ